MKKYKNLVWDWNGTLLDDITAGVETLNDMLEKRGLQKLSVEEYKDVFGFPVVDFYKKVGFDMEKRVCMRFRLILWKPMTALPGTSP